jgi:hypothetical protein
MDCVQVVLKDQYLNADNSEQSESAMNAQQSAWHGLSRAWTCAWTNRMTDVIRSDRIWADMYSVFRHVALARAILANRETRLALNGTMPIDPFKAYRPPSVYVPEQMVFVDFRKITLTRNRRNYWNTSSFCGGIDMTGTIERSSNDNADVRSIGEMVADSAKSCTTACWTL